MPVVAMTREMGSLGRDVAAILAQRRGRKVVYHEIIEQLANKMRLRKSHVARLLEGRAGLWERLSANETSLSIFTADETFRLLLDETTGVIRGWGAVHLLSGIAHVIRVRVCAPLPLRVERMMERLGTMDREAVQREVALSDEAHTAIARRHFRLDWRDPEHYDLVLSTARLGVEECADEIENLMALPRFQRTPDSARAVANRALEWSIRAQLRRDARTAGAQLRLECIDGFVRVSGGVRTRAQAQHVSEVVAATPGVLSLDNQVLFTVPASGFKGAQS